MKKATYIHVEKAQINKMACLGQSIAKLKTESRSLEIQSHSPPTDLCNLLFITYQ